jgi:amino acid adenylation domain-containing protein
MNASQPDDVNTESRNKDKTILKASVYTQPFWFVARRLQSSEQQRYHICRVFRYGSYVSTTRLRNALQRLADAQYNLRSNFFEDAGIVYQSIHARRHVTLAEHVADNLPDEQALLKCLMDEPFDLEKDPLFAFMFIRNIHSSETVFAVKFHHIVLTGADLDGTFAQIGAFYGSADSVSRNARDVDALLEFVDGEAKLRAGYESGTWRRRLEGLPRNNSMRSHANRVDTSFSQHAKVFPLAAGLTDRLTVFCTGLGCTVFDFLKVVWGIALSRFTGNKRVLINYPVDVRRGAGRHVKGAFINTLFYLHDNEGTLANALKNATFAKSERTARFEPTTSIIGECGLDAAAFHFTLFQSDFGTDGPQLRSDPVSIYLPCVGASEVLLGWNRDRVVYQHLLGAQVPVDFLSMLHAHMLHIVGALVSDPECEMATLPFPLPILQPRAGRLQEGPSCVPRILAFANQHPEQLAIVDGQRSITYCTLVEAAFRCARQIEQVRSGTSMRVAVMLPRGVEQVVAMLGTWLAGMTYVPLDMTQPEKRLAQIIDAGAPSVLIAETYQKPRAVWQGACIASDTAQWLLDTHEKAGRISHLDERVPAYVIYTSGSTGTPKGVLQTHRTLSHLVNWEMRELPVPRGACIAQIATTGFDVSLQEVTYALASGGTLHVVEDSTKFAPSRLVRFLDHRRIERVFLPTALLDTVCHAALLEGCELTYLQNITVAGEALRPTPEIRRFFEQHRNIRLFNEYGPSETHVALVNVNACDFGDGSALSIGHPIGNTCAYILGEQCLPVPTGMIGELWIGGDGVAEGYLNHADQTAQRFVDNPCVETRGWYPVLFELEISCDCSRAVTWPISDVSTSR